MTRNVNTDHADSSTAEVWSLQLGEIWSEFLRLKWLVLAVFITFIAAGVAYVSIARPIYRVSASLIPADNPSDLFGGRAAGSLGTLASLAGADLSKSGNDVVEAMAVMRSRRFSIDFIKDQNLMPQLPFARISFSEWSPPLNAG